MVRVVKLLVRMRTPVQHYYVWVHAHTCIRRACELNYMEGVCSACAHVHQVCVRTELMEGVCSWWFVAGVCVMC